MKEKLTQAADQFRQAVLRLFRLFVPGVIRRNYAIKFGIVILFIGLLFALVGVGATSLMAEQVEQSVDRDFESTATADAQALDNWLETNAIELNSLARNEPFDPETTLSEEEINDYLQTYRTDVADRSTLQLVHIVDPATNTVEFSSRTAFQGNSYDDGEVGWTTAPDFEVSGVGVSELYVAEDSYHAIAFTKELPDSSLLVAVHDVGDISTDILTGGANADIPDSYTMVVDSRDTIVMSDATAAADSPTIGTTYPQESQALANVRELEARTISGSIRVPETAVHGAAPGSGTHLVSYAPSGERVSPDFGSDWVVLVHAPESQAYGLAGDIQQGVFLFIGGALLAVLAVGGVFGRNTATAINRLSAKAAAVEDGEFDVEINSDRIDEIGQLSGSIAAMRDSMLQKIEAAEAATATAESAKEQAEQAQHNAEQARKEAEQLATQLEGRATAYGEVMNACAAGDLSQRLDEEAENEAMRSIANSFNAMLDQWEQTIIEIQRFADEVDRESQQASTHISEIRQASDEVAATTREIDEAAKEQQRNITTVSEEVSQLSATVEEVTATANGVAKNARKTTQAGEHGQEAATDALTELDAIQKQSQRAVETIEALDDGMAQINEIVGLITDLAEQTNMLALNANIEAARAGGGGSGAGFAVVASEVKSLAEETQAAVGEIEAVTDEIEGTTATAVEEIHEMRERIEDGSETVEAALGAFDEIAGHAADTNVGVQEIESATDEQARATQEVAEMADRVAELTDSTASDIEHVTTATQEQSESITDVVDHVQTLSTQAAELRRELETFSVSEREENSASEHAHNGVTEQNKADDNSIEHAHNGAPEQNAAGGSESEHDHNGVTEQNAEDD